MCKRIRLKLLISSLVVAIIFAFPQKIYATETEGEGLRYFYLTFQEGEEAQWNTKTLSFEELSPLEEKIYQLFADFFSSELPPSIPQGTRLLHIWLYDGRLTLNVSREILNYGGTSNEYTLLHQIVKTALDIPQVEQVRLLVEGMIEDLPEGVEIEEVVSSCKNEYNDR